ncbi:hypothetical protein [Halocynthiibacter sp.]|uniref:hypothetical protein n=1 Tax=Halocynthiibacter sp. TaxID=1979210 RepID=UPI003C56A454
MTAKVKSYEVTETRFIEGQHRKVGDPVQMTERAAKYYLAPYGTGLKIPGPRKEKVGGLDDPMVKKPTEHATGKAVGKPGK